MSTKPIIYKLILFSNWVKPKGVLELMLVYFLLQVVKEQVVRSGA